MLFPKYKLCRPIFRGIAILFLVYTGADLLAPQICAEERGFALPQSIISKSPDYLPVAYATGLGLDANDSEKNQTPNQHSQDEDCFCCCSHLVPGSVFDGNSIAEVKTKSIGIDHIEIPLPLPDTPYHPPRLA